MTHSLEVPDAFSSLRIQRDQAVCEQIIAGPIGPVKVGRSRTCRHEHNPSLRVECHACPIVRGSARLPRILRPGVVPKLTAMWTRVEGPEQFACADVV